MNKKSILLKKKDKQKKKNKWLGGLQERVTKNQTVRF